MSMKSASYEGYLLKIYAGGGEIYLDNAGSPIFSDSIAAFVDQGHVLRWLTKEWMESNYPGGEAFFVNATYDEIKSRLEEGAEDAIVFNMPDTESHEEVRQEGRRGEKEW